MLEDRILFIDGEAIVLDKPAGLPVDPPKRGGDSLAARIHELKCGFQRPPAVMHRLDQDTSGCLLLARNPKAHKRFAAAFEEGLADKTYLAVLDGVPETADGTVDLALGKRSTRAEGWRMVADSKGKPAVTDWRLLGVEDGRALVEFRPRTGRTHQLRVHAAEGLGVPIVGDPVYGDGKGAWRTMLHAVALEVAREGKTPIAATAPLPAEFAALGFADG